MNSHRCFLTGIALLISAFLGSVELTDAALEKKELEIGGWQLSSEWEGYMGVSLKFNDDGTFQYWFYSDVKLDNEPSYPLSGKWEMSDNVITLISTEHLYDTKYHVIKFGSEICLMPNRNYALMKSKPDDKVDYSRLHFHNLRFDINRSHYGRKSYKILGGLKAEE